MKYALLLLPLALSWLISCKSVISTESNVDIQTSMYAITNISLVDVVAGVTVPGQSIIVVDDRIEQIGEQEKIEIPQGATVIEGKGLYLMPGLIDAHVHYFDAPVFGRLMIANGVLLVRDMGMPNEYILPLRDQLNRGETLGPEMVATGYILDGDPPLIPEISLGIETPEEARLAVRQQAEAGVDMIKIYSTLKKEVFLAILEEADIHGLKVVGHVPDSIFLEDAAFAGLNSMEHWLGFEKVIARLLGEPVKLTYTGMGSQAFYLERLNEVDDIELEKVYQRLRESGLTVVPTVVTYKNYPPPGTVNFEYLPGSKYLSQKIIDNWKLQLAGQDEMEDFIWQNWAQMVKGLDQSGVPLMVGTDLMVPGIIPGFAVHQEMAIWQEAGIPAADILRSATLVPARFMDLADRLGSIAEGKTASMVLVRANPLEDIKNAQQIESVFLRGQYFNREALDRLLDEAKDLGSFSSNQ